MPSSSPVVVPDSMSACEANRTYGECFGVDWTYADPERMPTPDPIRCSACGGEGSIMAEYLYGGTFVQDECPCSTCDGNGWLAPPSERVSDV